MHFIKVLLVTVTTFVLVLLGVVASADGKTVSTKAKTNKKAKKDAPGAAGDAAEGKAKETAKSDVPAGVPVPTPTGQGAGGVIKGHNIPGGSATGLSTRAGGSGATHPVVKDLYNNVPKDKRSLYHGKCAEASALSKIATAGNAKTAEDLKNLCKGATSTVCNSNGTYLPPCSSCNSVLNILGIIAQR